MSGRSLFHYSAVDGLQAACRHRLNFCPRVRNKTTLNQLCTWSVVPWFRFLCLPPFPSFPSFINVPVLRISFLPTFFLTSYLYSPYLFPSVSLTSYQCFPYFFRSFFPACLCLTSYPCSSPYSFLLCSSSLHMYVLHVSFVPSFPYVSVSLHIPVLLRISYLTSFFFTSYPCSPYFFPSFFHTFFPFSLRSCFTFLSFIPSFLHNSFAAALS